MDDSSFKVEVRKVVNIKIKFHLAVNGEEVFESLDDITATPQYDGSKSATIIFLRGYRHLYVQETVEDVIARIKEAKELLMKEMLKD